MRHAIFLSMIAAFLCGNVVALAANQVIEQKGRAFSTAEVTIKKGDAISFVNNDSVTHNVMSRSAGNEFNIGAQTPGTSTPVTFQTAGEASILCAIHPQMRMMVKITD